VVRENEGVFVRREDAETLFAISGDESTIWDIPKPLKSETGHSTQKPVECMRRPILNNSKAGDLVYEPFSGSGTTIIAAEQTGRICYAVELSPAYVDVAVKRWENFTGRKATRT
jgi:DNA modification methylase